MLHTHDFDAASSTFLSDAGFPNGTGNDPRRAPRGLLVGVAIGATLWAVAIAAILAAH